MSDLPVALTISLIAVFTLAELSAVAGFGGGALLLPVFTGLFGLRLAVPVLTLTPIASDGGRVWFNRRHLRCGSSPDSAPARSRWRSPVVCRWRTRPSNRSCGCWVSS